MGIVRLRPTRRTCFFGFQLSSKTSDVSFLKLTVGSFHCIRGTMRKGKFVYSRLEPVEIARLQNTSLDVKLNRIDLICL